MADTDTNQVVLSAQTVGDLTMQLAQHLKAEKADLLRRVGDIEELLGFIDESGSLSQRVAKLEAFTGIVR